MNYLAHVFLSHDTPDAIVGAMLGDFVKGRAIDGWNKDVRAAILLHRAIDGYTDRHPLTRASRLLVSAERRRFAGILVDVFYDHFLARHWRRFHAVPLAEFTQMIYAALWSRRQGFPPRLQRVLPWMIRDDWLASYADVGAVDAALSGMARRRFRYAERARPLADGVRELERNYPALEANFLAFAPQLRDFARPSSAAGSETVLNGEREPERTTAATRFS
jgi:acyl carrier protein phosphodiesterase